jgi:parvulin-like peptidyl-prolyl isomerase
VGILLNKKMLVAFAAVMALALVLVGCGAKPVAEVNGNKISQKDYDNRVNNYIKALENQGYGSSLQGDEGKAFLDQIKKDTLEEMITHQLLLEEAKRLGVVPEKQLVTDKINEIKAQMSPEDYQEALKESNWSEKDLEEYFFEQLVELAVFEEVTKDVKVSEEEIADFHEMHKDQLALVRASHILVKTEEEALEVLAQLNDGADFAELAREKSIDTLSAMNGGDLDYFPRGKMVSEFEEASFSLPVGQITAKPIQTEHGYHIIKVTDKKETVDQLRDEIEGILAADEKAAAFDDFLSSVMDQAKITRNIKFD